jgi:hypothetical protein
MLDFKKWVFLYVLQSGSTSHLPITLHLVLLPYVLILGPQPPSQIVRMILFSSTKQIILTCVVLPLVFSLLVLEPYNGQSLQILAPMWSWRFRMPSLCQNVPWACLAHNN